MLDGFATAGSGMAGYIAKRLFPSDAAVVWKLERKTPRTLFMGGYLCRSSLDWGS